MADGDLSSFRTFKGTLSHGNESYTLKFRVRIDDAGEVQIDLGAIPLTQKSVFITKFWDPPGDRFGEFRLNGKARGGIQFCTENLSFRGLQRKFDASVATLRPDSFCTTARFTSRLRTPASVPVLRLHIKGFRNFRPLSQETELGSLEMGGPTDLPERDKITGLIRLRADNVPSDLCAWRERGDKLLQYVCDVMSFAAGSVLRTPVLQYAFGDYLETQCWSQSPQPASKIRAIHFLNQNPVFEAAVRSFFTPPFHMKHMRVAIEWFSMPSSHNEVRLVAGMTALENIIHANLRKDEAQILTTSRYDKISSSMRALIRSQMGDAQADLAAQINEKLKDLNRVSLFRKLKILSDRWNVPLHGIRDDRISAAINARNRVVHRGLYYDKEKEDDDDNLWEHVTTIREIVIRFLLTAISYKGQYESLLGGYHSATFPPKALTDEATVPASLAMPLSPHEEPTQ